MTERVTIDVDPDVVVALRYAAMWVPDPAPDVPTLTDLADAIESALPMPEPAVGSVVQASNGSLYARSKGPLSFPWLALTGPDHGNHAAMALSPRPFPGGRLCEQRRAEVGAA